MTDPFTPLALTLAPEAPPLARATNEDTAAFLTGPGFAMLIAGRIEQIEHHGHALDHDLIYDQAELALAAKAYLDSYIDLALDPDSLRKPGDLPESWPWQHDFWKEPGPADQAKALTKALALGLAELDRILAVQAINHAARPLGPGE